MQFYNAGQLGVVGTHPAHQDEEYTYLPSRSWGERVRGFVQRICIRRTKKPRLRLSRGFIATSSARRNDNKDANARKYSPTVTAAYMKDHHQGSCDPVYDPEGFDSYGYDKNDVDRAGNEGCDYYPDDDESGVFSGNSKYEYALTAWAFDGVKPVQIK